MYYNEQHRLYGVAIGNNSLCDIFALDGSNKKEVKCETTPLRTNQLCFENFDKIRNKPSGFAISEFDEWVHIALTPEGFIAFELGREAFFRLIREGKGVWDENKSAKFRLVPLREAERYAQRVFPFKTNFAEEIFKQGRIAKR